MQSSDSKTPRTEGAQCRWYACYTKARHEKKVAATLAERGIESFLPLVPRESQWKDRRKIVEWPMFPSYVFARFRLAGTAEVLSVPGVVGLVRPGSDAGAGRRAVTIPDEDIANVRRFAQRLQSGPAIEVEHRSFFAEGVPVEVVSGPFAGVRGVVVEDRGRQRVLIGLKQIGQATVVDVEAATLRPVPVS